MRSAFIRIPPFDRGAAWRSCLPRAVGRAPPARRRRPYVSGKFRSSESRSPFGKASETPPFHPAGSGATIAADVTILPIGKAQHGGATLSRGLPMRGGGL